MRDDGDDGFRENLSGKGARDIFFGEDFPRFSARDKFAIDEQHVVEDFRMLVEIVMRAITSFPASRETVEGLNEGDPGVTGRVR